MLTLMSIIFIASLFFSNDTELLLVTGEPVDGLIEAVSLDKNTMAPHGYWLDADKHKQGTVALVNFTDDDVHKEINLGKNYQTIMSIKKVLTNHTNYERGYERDDNIP